jgi:DNA polymerase elongation subunit (family B)
VFFTFNLSEVSGEPIRGKRALGLTIELAKQVGAIASTFLKKPHDLEYEKTFMPFCILSKKRYVGMLYENDPNKGKRKEMGIVLKRRDNAPIVKDIYGGIIDILMKEQNIGSAISFLRTSLQSIVDKECPIEKLIITKSLNSYYKMPQQIAHKVLADRIASRDPGNKPNVGDRIPFVYICNSNKKALQGEKIETPQYISANKLQIDYSFYITNQIMKPVQQLFSLVLEDIWKEGKKVFKMRQFQKECATLRRSFDDETYSKKIEALKNKEVKALLFDDYLRDTNNEKEKVMNIKNYFSR